MCSCHAARMGNVRSPRTNARDELHGLRRRRDVEGFPQPALEFLVKPGCSCAVAQPLQHGERAPKGTLVGPVVTYRSSRHEGGVGEGVALFMALRESPRGRTRALAYLDALLLQPLIELLAGGKVKAGQ